VAQYTASNVNQHTKDKKYSFIFRDQNGGKGLYVAADLLLTLAKNYSIIFHGNKEIGYGIFVIQEY